jgi:hypothetical protein
MILTGYPLGVLRKKPKKLTQVSTPGKALGHTGFTRNGLQALLKFYHRLTPPYAGPHSDKAWLEGFTLHIMTLYG